MSTTYNVYCDESCHLEHDHQPIMVLGAVWCPLEKTREISIDVREIKKRYGLPHPFEVKWKKVSPAKQDLYLELLDYFFSNNDLHFRALIVPDKSKLQHELYGQDHDTWYYKMYFEMLQAILSPLDRRPVDRFRIYIDIKDTRSAVKIAKLHEVLCNNMHDFERQFVERVQTICSHESEILQLDDLLIGTVSYVNRELSSNSAKVALVNKVIEKSGHTLTQTTSIHDKKVNLFVWRASEKQA